MSLRTLVPSMEHCACRCGSRHRAKRVSPGILQGGVGENTSFSFRSVLILPRQRPALQSIGVFLWRSGRTGRVSNAPSSGRLPRKPRIHVSSVLDWGLLPGSASRARKRRKEETGESWRACWPHDKQAAAMTRHGQAAQRSEESGGGFLNPSQRRFFFQEYSK